MLRDQMITVLEGIVLPLLVMNSVAIVRTAYAAVAKAGIVLAAAIHQHHGRTAHPLPH